MDDGVRTLRRVVPAMLLVALAFGPAEAVDGAQVSAVPALEWWCSLEGLHGDGRLLASTAMDDSTDVTRSGSLPALPRLTSGDGPRSAGTERAVNSNARPATPGTNR